MNTGCLGFFMGVIYGGFLGSRKAYMDFIERNHATAFETALQAKEKLQEAVTVSFAKSGWKFGWRLGLFVTMFMASSTFISVYNNKFSALDYTCAGIMTGGLYKWTVRKKIVFYKIDEYFFSFRWVLVEWQQGHLLEVRNRHKYFNCFF